MSVWTRLARARHRLERVGNVTAVRVLLFALLALAACWVGLRHAGQMNLYRDAQVLTAYEDAARRTLLRYGEIPLWNPYYCGGMYGLGSPQARFASPTFLLTLLFGTLRAEPLIVFAMMLVGLEGTFRYARSHGGSALGAMVAAPVFALSGHFAFSAALGWTNFMGFELLPWVLLGFRRAAFGEAKGAAIAALSLAWIVGFGGTYAAPMSAPLVAIEVLVALTGLRDDRKRVIAGLGMVTLAGLFSLAASAFRLWPVAETISAAPRIVGGAPGISVMTELRALLLPLDSGGGGDFEDKGTYYVGGFVIVALLFGAIRRDSLPLVVLGYLSLWLGAGYGLKPSLFSLLKALPIYDSLRYPERFMIPFALYVAALTAIGFARIGALARKRPKIGHVAFFLALVTVTGGTYFTVKNHHVALGGRWLAPPPDEVFDRDFHQARGNRWAAAYYPPMNRGSLACWDAYPVPESPLLRADLRDEAYVGVPNDPAMADRVKTTSQSPNRIELDVDLPEPARVHVNENAHPGWRSSEGELVSDHGAIAIDLPAGKRHVSLRFLPRSAAGGALVTVAALVAIALFLRRNARRVETPSALGRAAIPVVLPIVALASVWFLWSEPSASARLQTTQGEDVIALAPPEGATPAGVVFAGGYELVAIKLSTPSPRPGQTVFLELDWRARKPVQKGMGIFMHFDAEPVAKGATEDHLNGDHPTFSGVVDLDHAPEGKIIRDIVELSVPDDAAGKKWKVWVGLWVLKGRGDRIKVLSTGHATVEEDAVLAASFDIP